MGIKDYILAKFLKLEHNRIRKDEDKRTGVGCPHPVVIWFSEEEEIAALRRLKRFRITPERITHLEDHEIFVFGTSTSGSHTVGASRYAVVHFGATPGLASGLQGKSYAIPTDVIDPEHIRPFVEQFIIYAKNHPDNIFLVTPVGCGAAGHNPKEIAPLFKKAISLANICLPRVFWDVLL